MIIVRIKKARHFRDICKYSAFVQNKFSVEISAKIKSIKQVYYDKLNSDELDCWEIPQHHFSMLKKLLSNYDVEYINEDLLNENCLKYMKTKPFDHQIEAVQFGIQHPKFHLGDEQGLGKSKESIDIAVYNKYEKGYEHCLVVCGVSSLRWNWKDEIETHSNEQCCLLGFRKIKQGKNKGKLVDKGTQERIDDIKSIPEEYFWVINIEALRNEEVVKYLRRYCDRGIINMIIAEEVHKMKNPTCQQSRGFLKLNAETQISISGTPLVNNPTDLFVILKWHGIESHTYTAFKNRYCIMGGFANREIIGYQNLQELTNTLKKNQLRRLKKDVLSLPQKLPQTIYVEMGKKQESIYNEILINLQQNIDLIMLNPNPLAELIRLRQATGCPELLSSTIHESVKFDKLEELIEQISEKGEQCLIFSNWTQMCKKAAERLSKKYKVLSYTSENPDLKGTETTFKANKDIVALFGTIKLMGTGLTFTNCNHIIFLDSPWTQADKDQCIDRTHRIGQTQDVNIYTLVCAGTIDEKIEKIVRQKGVLSDAVVDNISVLSNRQTLDFLLF